MLGRLLLKGLWSRRQVALLTLASIAISVTLLLGVERLRDAARTSFASTVSGTDLLVGARTGPVNLLLYSVMHRGSAANGVSWATYRKIADKPSVAWTIPLMLGDSHHGYAVLGTNEDYFAHYRYADGRALAFAEGGAFKSRREAVVGAAVARELGYGLGREIIVSHGLGAISFARHDHDPYTVVGVLRSTGTPVDRTIHVSLQAIAAMHDAGGHEAEEDLTPAEITAFMVGLQSKSAVFSAQRAIDTYRGEALTAVIPGVALQELWETVGIAETALMTISGFVVIAGLLGMMTAVLTSLGERRREMAILRTVGAGPVQVAALLMGEVLLIAGGGIAVALMLLNVLLALAAPLVEARFGIHIAARLPTLVEWTLLGWVIAAATLMGLLPAWRAYRYSLADGLTPRL